MSELDQIRSRLEGLQASQYQLLNQLRHICETMFDQDCGMIDRVFPYALALEAARQGRYDLALRHLEGARCP